MPINIYAAIDRDDRLRMIKDRQNEERQRKLEELKAQAAAAQKYREQKEEERRRRIEDMRVRELDRKQQVEERKRAIQDAEKDRRDYILRKNQVGWCIMGICTFCVCFGIVNVLLTGVLSCIPFDQYRNETLALKRNVAMNAAR